MMTLIRHIGSCRPIIPIILPKSKGFDRFFIFPETHKKVLFYAVFFDNISFESIRPPRIFPQNFSFSRRFAIDYHGRAKKSNRF
jgi:hypothetical protein